MAKKDGCPPGERLYGTECIKATRKKPVFESICEFEDITPRRLYLTLDGTDITDTNEGIIFHIDEIAKELEWYKNMVLNAKKRIAFGIEEPEDPYMKDQMKKLWK